MIQDGKVDPLVAYYLTLENICETFGWLPSQAENENALDLEAFKAILRGRGKVEGGTMPKQIRRELSG